MGLNRVCIGSLNILSAQLDTGHLPRDNRITPRVVKLSAKIAQLRVEIARVEAGKVWRHQRGRQCNDTHH